jgi:hypothetical protein
MPVYFESRNEKKKVSAKLYGLFCIRVCTGYSEEVDVGEKVRTSEGERNRKTLDSIA